MSAAASDQMPSPHELDARILAKYLPDRRTFQVHRCRFVKWRPHSIRAFAFHSSGNKLAVARENGDIEVWDVASRFFCERRIPGSGQPAVQCLFWFHDRLFSAGLNARIIEWDLQKLLPKHASDSFGGAVWCGSLVVSDASDSATSDDEEDDVKAAHKPSERRGDGQLIVGCEDGSLRLFHLSAEDESQPPVYRRAFFKHSARVLSVDWQHGLLVSGGADGTIRLWDAAEGRNVSRITVERGPDHSDPTLVWAVKAVDEKTLVSGDSLGHVQLWDAKFGTLLQTFRQHQADVLAVAVSANGSTIYASGVDNAVAQYQRVDDKFVFTFSHRAHTHDVAALALSPVQTEGRGLLLSGGTDTQICSYVHHATAFASNYPSKIAPYPQRSVISAARAFPDDSHHPFRDRTRFLVVHDRKLEVWQTGVAAAGSLPVHMTVGAPAPEEKGPEASSSGLSFRRHLALGDPQMLMLEIPQPTGPHGLNVVAAAISPDAHYVACADPLSTRLYRMDWSETTNPQELRVRKALVEVEGGSSSGSTALTFTPDSKQLIAAGIDGVIRVFDLDSRSPTSPPSLVARFTQHAGAAAAGSAAGSSSRTTLAALLADSSEEDEEEDQKTDKKKKQQSKKSKSSSTGKLAGMVRTLSVSPDGQWLCSGDDRNRILLFSLDSLKLHMTLPFLESPHTAVSFDPKSTKLAVACANNQIFIFNTEKRALSTWSRAHSHKLPTSLLDRNDKITAISFDPTRPSVMLLQAVNFLLRIDLEKPLPTAEEIVRRNTVLGKRTKASTKSTPEEAAAEAAAAAEQPEKPVTKKRKRGGAAASEATATESASAANDNPIEPLNDNFRFLEQYGPMLFGQFLQGGSADQLMVVEVPWMQVLHDLPQPLYRHKYGT